MTSKPKVTGTIALLLGLASFAACGQDLKLRPRETLVIDDVGQSYEVAVLATADGAASYSAYAHLYTNDTLRDENFSIPEGDTLTLDGVAMTETTTGSGVYLKTGRGNPGTYAFVWTHGDTKYSNTVTATAYPAAAIPATFSKGAPTKLDFAGVPAGVTVTAALNAGAGVGPPFFPLAVQVAGGGTATKVTMALSGLAVGPGVLTVDETTTSALQEATKAGGQRLVTVQYGYYVTIAD